MEKLHLYLHRELCDQAVAGRFNLANRMAAAIAPLGMTLAFHPDTAIERARATSRPGWSLFHMHEPQGPRCLNLRRAYHYPFWRIEATNERWNFDVAQAAFDPAGVDPEAARRFAAFWRARIHGDAVPRRQGFVLVPLQGRLTECRSFQSMSPLAMIETVLEATPQREIRVSLHPGEVYIPEEVEALETLATRHPRLRIVPAAPALLADCDHVVTQNSSVALNGFFLGKRAVLFARIDFHHIAGSVPRDGLAAAFDSLHAPAPEFDRYLYWFFHHRCINGGSPDAEGQILSALRRHGWPH
ncbi:MAG: hypothetical protein QM656_08490 [Paracoccaceae bacterium]